MNLRLILKAMSFMFLPTLGVLVILLVGFFDAAAMWDFIKSNNGWAIFVRVTLLLAEIILVIVLYYYYQEQEEKELVLSGEGNKMFKTNASYDTELQKLFSGSVSYRDKFKIYDTKIENIKIVEYIKKEED